MKIPGPIHALNDEEVIDTAIAALLEQTYPIEETFLVDNASSDGMLRRAFPSMATIIRQKSVLGGLVKMHS